MTNQALHTHAQQLGRRSLGGRGAGALQGAGLRRLTLSRSVLGTPMDGGGPISPSARKPSIGGGPISPSARKPNGTKTLPKMDGSLLKGSVAVRFLSGAPGTGAADDAAHTVSPPRARVESPRRSSASMQKRPGSLRMSLLQNESVLSPPLPGTPLSARSHDSDIRSTSGLVAHPTPETDNSALMDFGLPHSPDREATLPAYNKSGSL